MTTYTENYNLEMPDQNEFYNVDVQNQNMQKIDTAIKEAGNNEELEGNVAGLVEKIGTTTDVGGSTTTGSSMAKLNALLKTVGNSDTSLSDLIASLINKSMVKSVQSGVVTIASSSSSTKTVTINSVDTLKSLAFVSGGSSSKGIVVIKEFTSTSLTIDMPQYSETAFWQVIEFV